MDPVSISPYVDYTFSPVSIDPTASAANPLSPKLAQVTAAKAHLGLAATWDKTYEDIYNGLLDGSEDMLRAEASALQERLNGQTRERLLMTRVVNNNYNINDDDLRAINAALPPTDPKTIFETKYADRVMGEPNRFTQREGDTLWSKAYKEIPVLTERAAMLGSTTLATTELGKRLQQDAVDTLSKQGWGSYLADIGKDVATFGLYSEVKMRSQPGNVGFLEGGLYGGHLAERAKADLDLPPGAREKQILSTYEKLKADNPSLALTYANSIVGLSLSDQHLDNVLSAINIFTAPVAGVAKALGRGAKSAAMAYEVREAVKDILKNAGTTGDITPGNIAIAVGDVGEGAVQNLADDIFKGTNAPMKRAFAELPSGLKTMGEQINAGKGSLGNGFSAILTEQTNRFATAMMTAAAQMQKIQRIPLREATVDQLRQLKERAKDFYPGMRNAILDVSEPVHEPFSNTYNYDLKIGNHSGLLFSDAQTAEEFMRLNGLTKLGTVDVDKNALQRSGLGYFIRVNASLRETDDIIRDLFTDTAFSKPPQAGLIKSALSWLRTPEDTVSMQHRINRKVVTYAEAQLRELAEHERQYIQRIKDGTITIDPVTGEKINFFKRAPANLYRYVKGTVTRSNKQSWDRLDRTLLDNQKMKGADDVPGKFFENPQQLEEYFLKTFKEMPTQEETMAYFAHKRLNEMDRVIRTMELYRTKARVGVETHSIMVKGLDGKLMTSKPIEGIRIDHVPGGDDAIMVIRSTIGRESIYENSAAMGKTTRANLLKEVKEGKMVGFRIYDPEKRPLQEFGTKVQDRRIRYVFAKNVETSPLSWDQVPYRGGGHFEYDYPLWIKQAKIAKETYGNGFRHWYEGDTTVMPMLLGKQGKDLVDKMNAVRELIAANDINAAKELAGRTLPMEWKEFYGWFNKRVINGVTESPRLSKHEPFVLVPKDELIGNMQKRRLETYSNFKDGTRSGSDARQYQVKYTQERDAFEVMTANDIGTKGNPVYKYEPATLVDPITMMNRALSRVINSNLMDDYKIYSVESWIREAEPYLKGDISEIRSAPLKFFNKPEFTSGTPKEVEYMLKSNHFKIRQFLGQPSTIDTFLHTASQKVADWAYDKIGPKAALIPQWMTSHTTDPISFTRGMVYHMKLGLFALPQLIVQNMTYATIFALSPKQAINGTAGAFFHHWAKHNPQMLDTVDKYISRLGGWKRGEFTESFTEMGKTGFGHVGGEYINLDNISNYKLVQSAGRTFLDWGQGFFRAGERNVRYGAWHTAFKEFREANPFGRITEADRAKILDRADLLTTNMSRASASAMHTGVFSLTSQFLSYQMRLAELFFSKRIGETVTERSLARARILGVYSALFGVPSAIGVTGVPAQDYLRKTAMENGYVVGDQWLSTLFNEGIPSWITTMATGNTYNIGGRYGSQGFEQIKDALRGDKPLWTLMGGATASVGESIWKSTGGIRQWMMDGISGTGEFRLTPEDLVAPLQEIQSVKGLTQAIAAVNTGHWMSKNEHDLTKVTSLNAIVMSMMGLQPQSVSDAFVKNWSLKQRQELMKFGEEKFQLEMQRSLREADNNNYNQSRDFMRRAFSWLITTGYPEEDWPKAIAKGMDRNRDLVTRIDDAFYTRNIPTYQKPTLLDAQIRANQQGRQQ